MAVREQHLANARTSFAEGTLSALAFAALLTRTSAEMRSQVEGGAFFNDDKAKNDPNTKMAGSWLLIHAENIEKAREWLMEDIYTKGGAWDPSKFQIYSVARAKH